MGGSTHWTSDARSFYNRRTVRAIRIRNMKSAPTSGEFNPQTMSENVRPEDITWLSESRCTRQAPPDLAILMLCVCCLPPERNTPFHPPTHLTLSFGLLSPLFSGASYALIQIVEHITTSSSLCVWIILLTSCSKSHTYIYVHMHVSTFLELIAQNPTITR